MNEKIKFYIADAAGNVTLFVTSHVSEQDYAKVAGMLLDKKDLGGEQVAFVMDKNTMCMCGHEFCGNASRAFALMKAKGIIHGSVQSHYKYDKADRVAKLYTNTSDDLIRSHNAKSDPLKITINTSGAPCPLDVTVNPETDYTKIKMPNPVSFSELNDCTLEAANGSPVIDMGGIVHVIAHNLEPTSKNFRIIKDHIMKNSGDVPALGVMFVDDDPTAGDTFVDDDPTADNINGGKNSTTSDIPIDYDSTTSYTSTYSDPAADAASAFDDPLTHSPNIPTLTHSPNIPTMTHSPNIPTITMTPVVYVRDVDSTFFEGSCGSGTTALCAALSKNKSDGAYVCHVRQPRGTITCTCKIKAGQIDSIYIEGPVSISEEHEL